MRCPDCNKFVQQEPAEPEVQSLEVDTNEVRCEARLAINCADCGTELKEGIFTMDETLPDDVAKEHSDDGHELEVEEDNVEIIDEYQTKDRHGKPIKNMRYQKHLYGVIVECSVRCSCQEDGAEPLCSFTLEDKMPAGAFDELV